MITILSVIACVHGHNAMCAEIAVPTPITFACDDPRYTRGFCRRTIPASSTRRTSARQAPPHELWCEHRVIAVTSSLGLFARTS